MSDPTPTRACGQSECRNGCYYPNACDDPTPSTASGQPRCDTCGDTGLVPWMSENDPNGHQLGDVDVVGNLPCPDCTASGQPAVCAACGGDASEGPIASNGDHWCGECYREGVVA